MPTMTHMPPRAVGDIVAPILVSDRFVEDRPDPTTSTPTPPGGFLRLLAQGTLEQARADGPVSAVRDLLRPERFLRSFRRHLLLKPREAWGDSYKIGLIMIELMILRESLRSPSISSAACQAAPLPRLGRRPCSSPIGQQGHG